MTTSLTDHPPVLTSPPPAQAGRLLSSRPVTEWADHIARWGAVPDRSPSELIAALEASRLTGRGGAGFPAGRKVATVAAAGRTGRAPIVVANCCEGDPTAAKDHALLDTSPHLVVDGALAVAAATGADRVVFAAHRDSAIDTALRRALARRPVPGPAVEVAGVPGRYLASEATALVRFLDTGDARPRGRSTPIWERGVAQRPTLVANAETLAHVALIARFGAGWFSAVGSPDDPGTVLLTLGGSVPRPGVVEVATDRTLGAAVARAGHPGTGWALIGGLGGRWADLGTVAGLRLGAADLARAGLSRGVGSVVTLPPGTCVLGETARILRHQADAGARQCGPCMFGLPAVAADLTVLVEGDAAGLERLRRRLPVIDGRGGCGHPDATVALAAGALAAVSTHEPDHLAWHLAGRTCPESAVVPLTSPVTGGR